jgi:TrmH family RNA methyltransferase
MGFENLILVRPECEIGVEARARAMKGADILDRAQYFPDFPSAIEKLGIVVGTTGRFAGEKPYLVECQTFTRELLPTYSMSLGVAFGSEENGLARDEVQLCHWLVEISTGSEYPVMNLAQAVAVVAYEMHIGLTKPMDNDALHLASPAENKVFLEFLEHLLTDAQLPKGVKLPLLMKRIKKIAARARLEKEDINLLRGLLTALANGTGRY